VRAICSERRLCVSIRTHTRVHAPVAGTDVHILL
jgi:hypothetical protein